MRAIVRRVAALEPYARRTGRLGETARRVRDAVLQAREPARLLFEDLPAACGCARIVAAPAGAPATVARRDPGPSTVGGGGGDTVAVDSTDLAGPTAAAPAGEGGGARFADGLRAALREIEGAYDALLDRTRRKLADALHLPAAPPALAAELRPRAAQIRDVAAEPALAGFVLRAADDALDPDDLLISLRTQLADRPPQDWSDADEDRFTVRLADVARRFRNAEALRIGSGGPDDRQGAVLLAVTRRGRTERKRVLPLRPADHARVDRLRKRLLAVLEGDRNAAAAAPEDALTALALAAETLLETGENPAGDTRKSPQPEPESTADREGE